MRWESLMLDLGTPAPQFRLPDPDGRMHTLEEFKDARGLMVTFICNHCPFVQHILDGIVRFAADYRGRGLATVAISSNDVSSYPDDSPQKMRELAASRGFSFPYLYDETQEAAIAFRAVCTPDFFLFDAARRLAYRGQFDGSRPHTLHDAGKPRNVVPVTGIDLRAAADAVLAGRPALPEQFPSRGCSMKWKPGNEPEWG